MSRSPAVLDLPPQSTCVSAHSTADFPQVVGAVTAAMARLGYPDSDLFAVRLSLEEALTNAIKHGHQGDTSRLVQVRYDVTAEQVVVEVEDEGPGFDPDQVPDPRSAERLERCGGRGLYLMRCFMSSVQYNERGNAVTLCKQRSEPDRPAAKRP